MIVSYKDSGCRYIEAYVSTIVSNLDLEDCDVQLCDTANAADTDHDHIADAKDNVKVKPEALIQPKKRTDLEHFDCRIAVNDKKLLFCRRIKHSQQLMEAVHLGGDLPLDAGTRSIEDPHIECHW